MNKQAIRINDLSNMNHRWRCDRQSVANAASKSQKSAWLAGITGCFLALGGFGGLAISAPASATSDVFDASKVEPKGDIIKSEHAIAKVQLANPEQVVPLLVDDLVMQDRQQLIQSIDHSLRYIRTNTATQKYPVAGISRDQVERSLIRLKQLVQAAPSPEALSAAIVREYDFYKSVGLDQRGTVHFTGYYEAVYPASRVQTDVYKYPIYSLPQGFTNWRKPHPTRAQIENDNLLKGQELAWLSDRFQAFLIHVQGSARLQLPDNTVMSVGYAGKTEHKYTSVGAELVKDGKMKLEDVTLQALIDYFAAHPRELKSYLQRNKSFVFFRATNGSPATGSLGVPVTAERSIATDKSIMPPGAIALIRTNLPMQVPGVDRTVAFADQFAFKPVARLVLDQDTGSAIKGAGRVDIFMGTGQLAKDRAGLVNTDGELYYLILKN
jgi:membrane-bound lytic murein transglycosylase A